MAVFTVALSLGIAARATLPMIFADDLSLSNGGASIAAHLNRVSEKNDKLFVWGWQPRVYVATKLIPASQFVSASTVVYDFSHSQAVPDTFTPSPEMHQLLRELSAAKPRFFVDASDRSYVLSSDCVYEIERHPLLYEFLQTGYVYRGSFDGYRLYERASSSGRQ
jgi:hypothetical protein